MPTVPSKSIRHYGALNIGIFKYDVTKCCQAHWQLICSQHRVIFQLFLSCSVGYYFKSLGDMCSQEINFPASVSVRCFRQLASRLFGNWSLPSNGCYKTEGGYYCLYFLLIVHFTATFGWLPWPLGRRNVQYLFTLATAFKGYALFIR